MPQRKFSSRTLLLACMYIYLTLGMLVLTTNAALGSLIAENHWSDGLGGLLVALQSAGNTIASLLGGLALRRFGHKRTLAAAQLCGAVGFVGLALVKSPSLMFPLIFLTGIYWGTCNNVVNILVAEATHGNAARINTLHAAYAVGAVIAPLVVGLSIGQSWGWRPPVFLVTLLLLIGVAVATLVVFPEERPLSSAQAGQGSAFWRDPRFYLGTGLFFLYVGGEVAVCAWLAPYLSANNAFFATVRPEVMLSLMWVVMIIGRLLSATLATRIEKTTLLAVQAGGFLLGMFGLVAFPASTPLVIFSVCFMGLSMSAIYGTIVANNSELIASSTLVPGLMFAGGGLGAAVVPLLAGVVSDWGGIRLGMASLLVLLAGLVGLALVNRARARRAESSLATNHQ